MWSRMTMGHIRGLVFLVSLLAGVAIAWPALAQMGLNYIAPREVETWSPSGPVSIELVPEETVMDLEEVENAVAFPLLTPAYLTPGCGSLVERFYFIVDAIEYQPRVAVLNYPCLGITERRAQSVDRPFLGEGSVQETNVNGAPAILINGSWLIETSGKLPPSGEIRLGGTRDLTWVPGTQHLMFERSGIVIQLTSDSLTPEELIQFAESMR